MGKYSNAREMVLTKWSQKLTILPSTLWPCSLQPLVTASFDKVCHADGNPLLIGRRPPTVPMDFCAQDSGQFSALSMEKPDSIKLLA